MAAPAGQPMNPRSQIGVSQSRTGPKRSNKPVVVAKFPPRLPIPSPITKIRGFLAISSVSASRVAFMKVSSRPPDGGGVFRTGTLEFASTVGPA